MRRVKVWSTVKDWPAGFHNPRTNITVTDRHGLHVLEGCHGSDDNVEVFRDGDDYYVLSWRARMPYVGLSFYHAPAKHGDITKCEIDPISRLPKLTPHPTTNEVFAQGDEVADYLGSRDALDKYQPATIARRLREWVDG